MKYDQIRDRGTDYGKQADKSTTNQTGSKSRKV
ncbi:unnamed protein product [Rotaria sordida]|uniref:Uncharacterized protein n=1 Tax=Rotaria sordida TaxID=392033 RepID=A0A818UIG8_9BILA|nr:unnamed protein product [Rotaria sordida]CAF3699051.1 unnamed protein product [Rotaria sordida]